MQSDVSAAYTHLEPILPQMIPKSMTAMKKSLKGSLPPMLRVVPSGRKCMRHPLEMFTSRERISTTP